MEQATDHALSDRHHLFGIEKRRFDIDLGEFWLSIRPQIFVAEAACDLVITIEPRHHQQLLKKLGGLGQRKKRARLGSAGHQIIPRALGCRPRQNRGFDIQETLLVEIATNARGDLCPGNQVLLHLRPTQIHKAVTQADVLTYRVVLVERERRRLCGVENLQAFTQHLYLPGGHIRIHRLGRARANAPCDAQHILAAHAVGALKMFLSVRIKHHLHHAFPVAHVEENDTTMVPATIYPATQRHRLIDQIFIDQAAVVGSHRCFHGVVSRR